MYKITKLDKLNDKNRISDFFQFILIKISSIIELVIILSLWLLVFSRKETFASFGFKEIFTYILIGNIVGFAASYFWAKIITNDIIGADSKLMLYKPGKYCLYILTHSFNKFLIPFVFYIGLNLLLLNFFVGNFPINLNLLYLSLILLIVVLAFVTEFLLAYLISLFVFWTIESADIYNVMTRFKKLLAGAYFPLSLLPPILFKISMFLPFAYSFYVPTQLYLKKIDWQDGLNGIIIQVLWIIILYFIIKFSWQKKHQEINSGLKS